MPEIFTSRFPQAITKHLAVGLVALGTLAPSAHAQDSSALMDRMEPGSIVKDLLIPQYNEKRLATVVLRMDQATVLPASCVQAINTSLHLIRNETAARLGSTMLRIDECIYNTSTHLLDSTSAVRATSPRFDIQCQGLIGRLDRSEKNQLLFLRPPVIGFMQPRATLTESAMKTPRTLASALLLALAATAEEPKKSPAPAAPDLTLLTINPRNQAAEEELLAFAKKHNIPLQSVTPPPLPAAALAPVDPAQEIPQFKATAESIGFACKGGVVYSSGTSTLTFLDQVTVRDPAYAMTVAGKVLVTFLPEPIKKSPASTPPEKDQEKDNALGILSTITGEGGVAFEAADKGGVKNFASGDSIVYDEISKIATLTGRRLIFQQGSASRFESMNPDAWLKFNRETKDFAMSDGWKAMLTAPRGTKTPNP